MVAFLAFGAAAGAAIWAALIVADPFDTARLTPLPIAGMTQTGPRLANASRARDPRFDAAVIGNSTLQLIAPSRLKALTGLDFVQLSTPGTGPVEQAALAEHLFRIRGAAIKALVVGLDMTWCDASRETRTEHSFPFWLYDRSDLAYAASLFRMDSLEFLFRRVAFVLGRNRPARPDGFWDYEADGAYDALAGRALAPPLAPTPGPDGRRAADGALARLLDAAPAGVRVVLVHPPVYAPAGAEAAGGSGRDACKAALALAARGRPGATFVDFWIDDEAARTRAFFHDAIHMAGAMARRVEEAVAARLVDSR